MSRRLLTGLLALALITLVGGVWYVAAGPGGELAAAPRIGPADPSSSGSGARTRAELEDQVAGRAEAGADETRAAVADQGPVAGIAAARGRWWDRPKNATWVTGTLVMPPGTPFDEEIVIEAEGATFPSDPESRRKYKAKLDEHGNFRVAFAPKTRVGRLDVLARFAYLEERFKIELDDPEQLQDVRLEPKLGGLVLVTVLPPHHAAFADDPLRGVKVTAGEGRGFGSSAKDGWWTGREGEWEVGGLSPGESYTVQGRSPIWADGKTEDVEISAGRVTTASVALSVGVRLSGTVVDEQGQVVPGGEVSALTVREASSRNPFMRSSDLPSVDASGGTFELNGVPPADLILVAEVDGYIDGELELGELSDGAERHGLTVRVDSGGKVRGIVRWPGGEPAEGALVRVAQGDTLGARFEIERVKGTIEVGPDGTFYFSGLDPEVLCNVGVTAIHPDDRPNPNSRVSLLLAKKIPRWIASQDKIRPGSPPLDLELSPGDVLSGKVVNDQGEAVKAFFVQASPAGNSMLNRTSRKPVRRRFRDEKGVFHLKGVAPGNWEVKVTAQGHANSERRPITVPNKSDLTFTIARTGEVSGVVYRPSGAAAAGARVMVEHGGGKTAATSADEEGLYEVRGLNPGEVSLTADSSGMAASRPVVLHIGAAEAREDVALRLQPGATIVAQVHAEAGAQEGRTIKLRRLGGDQPNFPGAMGRTGPSNSKTDAGGTLVFEGLDAGSYELELAPPGGVQWNGDPGGWLLRFANQKKAKVEVAAGQTAQVVLGGPSPSQVRVHGRITAAGEPVEAGLVTAMDLGRKEDRPSAAANADEAGRYEVKLDNGGKWRFSVRAAQGEWTSMVVDIPEGEEFELDFVVPETRLVGLLTGPDGSPLPTMLVSMSDSESDDVRNNWFAQRTAATDDEGRYEFKNLSPGTYHLRAGGTDGGFGGMLREKGADYGRVLVVINVGEDEGVIERDLQLPAAGQITGNVRDSSGQPVGGARIRVTDEEGRPLSKFEMFRSQPDGAFTYGGLGAGTYLISASEGSGDDERIAAPRKVRVYEGDQSQVVLVLE